MLCRRGSTLLLFEGEWPVGDLRWYSSLIANQIQISAICISESEYEIRFTYA